MELSIKPDHRNNHPIKGMILKGQTPKEWIVKSETIGFSIRHETVYPIPGRSPNSIYGCFIEFVDIDNKLLHGNFEYCQLIHDLLFIPEHSQLYPKVDRQELQVLLKSDRFLLHPDVGLFKLDQPVLWPAIVKLNAQVNDDTVIQPEKQVFIPSEIKGFQVIAPEPDDVLRELESDMTPERKNINDINKPLNIVEKFKLHALKQFFVQSKDKTRKPSNFLASISEVLGKPNIPNNLQVDLEQLEKRNQKALNKLLDLLEKNPEEGLKYAIPLDEKGTSRGHGNYSFELLPQWLNFSLFNNSGRQSRRGGNIDLGDGYFELREQYIKSAQTLIEKGDHKGAAFIYLKLLNNELKAAETLEDGGYFQEAASIYLKHCNNKAKAAECYEKGYLYVKAIALHQELGNHERAGDLFLKINDHKNAMSSFEKAAEIYLEKNQYIKAAIIYRQKMDQKWRGQDLLLKGWSENRDAYNCLNNYFANIDEHKSIHKEIADIYKDHVDNNNKFLFLDVISMEYKKHELSREQIRKIAYQIISEHAHHLPQLVDKLSQFNEKDAQLTKDIFRYKIIK